jgi:hypothetical protein
MESRSLSIAPAYHIDAFHGGLFFTSTWDEESSCLAFCTTCNRIFALQVAG